MTGPADDEVDHGGARRSRVRGERPWPRRMHIHICAAGSASCRRPPSTCRRCAASGRSSRFRPWSSCSGALRRSWAGSSAHCWRCATAWSGPSSVPQCPAPGGRTSYLREAFQYRTGRLMPFLFVWTAILFIPLIMSTGVYGFVSYLRYLWPSMTTAESYAVGLGAIVVIVALLWRRIESIGKMTAVLWAIMILTLLSVILAAYTHFHAGQVFTFPAGAFDLTRGGFWIGFAGGLTIGVYDYLGYNTSAYLGAEIKRPGRAIPRSIVYAVLAMMVVYLSMQVGILGVVNWHEMLDTNSQAFTSVASLV